MTLWDKLLLSGGWILWCFLHSLLISHRFSGLLQQRLGTYRYHYRLLYNVLAIVTIIPLVIFTAAFQGEKVELWQGWWRVLQLALLIFALWLFREGGRNYDFGYLIGYRQIQERCHQQLLGEKSSFGRAGAHGMVRHPWYLGGIIALWTFLPVYHESSIVTAITLTIYFLVGARLEERKLVAEFGDTYREYQDHVSMLFPWKYLKNRLAGKGKWDL